MILAWKVNRFPLNPSSSLFQGVARGMENININRFPENPFLQQRLELQVIYTEEEIRASACAHACGEGRSGIKWVGENTDFEITHFCLHSCSAADQLCDFDLTKTFTSLA